MTKKPSRDDVLLRLLKTPPKPHADEKHPRAKKVKQSRAKRPKSKTNAS